MKALSNFVGKCFIVSFFMMFVEVSLAQDVEIVSYIGKNSPLYELEKSLAQDLSELSYLKDGNSLMPSTPRIGSYYLTVDTPTPPVLKSIGWNINDPSKIEIVCDDASDNGIMSAYTQHSFHVISTMLSSITSPQWKLTLPLSDGNDEEIFLNDGGLSCTVPTIKDENKYNVNINGDIYGILDFSCTLNGCEIHAASYRLSLELKPRIEYVKIYKIVQHPELQTYDVFFEAKYMGADYITIDIEEEYGSWLRTKTIYEPYLTNGICEQITAPYQAWISFSVRNNYGVDTYTVELGPYGEVINTDIFNPGNSQIADIRDQKQVKYIEVYDINGAFIDTFNSISDLNANLRKGVYILKEVYSSGIITTKKYVK